MLQFGKVSYSKTVWWLHHHQWCQIYKFQKMWSSYHIAVHLLYDFAVDFLYIHHWNFPLNCSYYNLCFKFERTCLSTQPKTWPHSFYLQSLGNSLKKVDKMYTYLTWSSTWQSLGYEVGTWTISTSKNKKGIIMVLLGSDLSVFVIKNRVNYS